MAMGAGGLSVALAMAGEPYVIAMPKVVKINLTGRLSGWATAKDVILHLLGLLTVKGGVGKVMEYAGPGVATLSVPERAVITNMGAELGATTSIFPSDAATKAFLTAMGRPEDFTPLAADPDADLRRGGGHRSVGKLEPLAAAPHMPDRMVRIADLAGMKVDQVCIGSCTNSSYADLKAVAAILAGKRIDPTTDLLIAPGSKQVLKMLAAEGRSIRCSTPGRVILECACGPCIGMGGSPVSGGVSARTFNRNFEGRSGTQDGQVYLVSPQTAAMAALRGEFSDPATWGEAPAKAELPAEPPPTSAICSSYAAGRRRGRGPSSAAPTSPRCRPLAAAAGRHRGPGGAQGRRRHHHRPHPAGRRPDYGPALQHPGDQRIHLQPGGRRLRVRASKSSARASSWPARTTARAPAASTPPWGRAIWAWPPWWPSPWPASTGPIWSISASCRCCWSINAADYDRIPAGAGIRHRYGGSLAPGQPASSMTVEGVGDVIRRQRPDRQGTRNHPGRRPAQQRPAVPRLALPRRQAL